MKTIKKPHIRITKHGWVVSAGWFLAKGKTWREAWMEWETMMAWYRSIK